MSRYNAYGQEVEFDKARDRWVPVKRVVEPEEEEVETDYGNVTETASYSYAHRDEEDVEPLKFDEPEFDRIEGYSLFGNKKK